MSLSVKGNPYLCIGTGSSLPHQNFAKSSEYLVLRDRSQWSNMSTWILHEDQDREERRDDGRLSLLTGDCPDCHLNQLWFGINLCSPPIGQQARTALAEASHWLRPAVICNQFLSRISMDLAWPGLSNDGAMLDFFFHLWTRSGAGKLNGEWILFFFVDLESGLASLASDLESLLS